VVGVDAVGVADEVSHGCHALVRGVKEVARRAEEPEEEAGTEERFGEQHHPAEARKLGSTTVSTSQVYGGNTGCSIAKEVKRNRPEPLASPKSGGRVQPALVNQSNPSVIAA